MKSVIVGLACAAALLAGPTRARADSILVTSGSFSQDNLVEGHVVSDIFDLGLTTGNGVLNGQLLIAGQLLPGGMATVTFDLTGPVTARGTIDGVSYEPASQFGADPLHGTADLVFATAPFAFSPTAPLWSVHTTVPFTLSGTLDLASAAGPVLNDGLFSSGMLTMNLDDIRIAGSSFSHVDVVSARFVEESPSPTPEPTTILLLGTGIVGLAVGRGRRFLRTGGH